MDSHERRLLGRVVLPVAKELCHGFGGPTTVDSLLAYQNGYLFQMLGDDPSGGGWVGRAISLASALAVAPE
jgi:hypothetical protein